MRTSVATRQFRLFVELLEDRALPGYALAGLPAAASLPPQAGELSSWLTSPGAGGEGSLDDSSRPVGQPDFTATLGGASVSGTVRGTSGSLPDRDAAPFTSGDTLSGLGHTYSTGQAAKTLAPERDWVPVTVGAGAEPRHSSAVAVTPVGAAGWSQALAEAVATHSGGPSTTGTFELAPPFADSFTAHDLGSVPGLPTNYGGFTLAPGDANTLLITGESDTSSATVYAIGLVRDASGHITGFSGEAVGGIATPYLAGNLVYGPESVFFYPRWPQNEVGQVLPGSKTTNKVVDVGALGVTSSVSGLQFVPQDLPGAGQLKLLSWSGGEFYKADYAPDGTGTYDITSATPVASLPGGPTGFSYLYPVYPQINVPSILVAEWSASTVSLYDVDSNGDPLVNTRREFLTGDAGFHAPWFDPFTGDILIGTWGGNNRLVAVRPRTDVSISLPSAATYLFNDTLNAEQPAAPALLPLDPRGLNRFETVQMYGQARRVYRFDGDSLPQDMNAGLQLNTTGLVAPNSYTVEMIFEFVEDTGGYRRVIDVAASESDYGFYVDPSSRLRVYPEQESGGRDFGTNTFHHVVLANAAGNVRVYLDGLLDFVVPSTTVMNINNPGNWLSFFADDKYVTGEYADGRIALLRVYNGVLNDSDVLLLASDPFLYP